MATAINNAGRRVALDKIRVPENCERSDDARVQALAGSIKLLAPSEAPEIITRLHEFWLAYRPAPTVGRSPSRACRRSWPVMRQRMVTAQVCADARGPAQRRSVVGVLAFFGLAFALSWAWWIPLALDGQMVGRGNGWPTHIPGLLGPLLAALVVLAVTEGGQGVRQWAAGFVRWPRELRWRLAAVAPVGFLALGVAVVAVLGELPPASDFVRFSGAAPTVAALLVAITVGAFGEEAGWRGYALPRLQSRLAPLRATLLLALLWAAWHAPLFFLLASYGDFSVLTVPGFVIGLTAGALVLTSVYNATGGSILAVAVWHATYNLSAATAAADGTIAAVSTACVIFWAVSLIQAERAGRPALGGERHV